MVNDQRGSFCLWVNVGLHSDTCEVDMPALCFFLLPRHADKGTLDVVVHHCAVRGNTHTVVHTCTQIPQHTNTHIRTFRSACIWSDSDLVLCSWVTWSRNQMNTFTHFALTESSETHYTAHSIRTYVHTYIHTYIHK